MSRQGEVSAAGPGRWSLLFVIRPCVFVEWQILLIRFGLLWQPFVSVLLVPGARLELARPFGQRILSLAQPISGNTLQQLTAVFMRVSDRFLFVSYRRLWPLLVRNCAKSVPELFRKSLICTDRPLLACEVVPMGRFSARQKK